MSTRRHQRKKEKKEESEEEEEEEEEEQEEEEEGGGTGGTGEGHWGRSSGNCGRIFIRGGRRGRGARNAQRKEAAHRCSKLAAGTRQLNNTAFYTP